MMDDEDNRPYNSLDAPPPPPFPHLIDEAEKIVNLEQAVRWERAKRGLSVDGIDDWKRKDIIIWYAFLVILVIVLGILVVNRK